MIISHKHKFIFIKTNKTAGTSIELALSKFCGPDDIITPFNPEDEELRRCLGLPGPQNYRPSLWPLDVLGDIERKPYEKEEFQFYNHISSREIIEFIGKNNWHNYYTFCFERNPWDRVISHYYWFHKSEPRPSIQKFLRSKAPMILKTWGYKNYTIDDDIVVDKVCKYEHINDELETIRKLIGIPQQLELPWAKSKFRKDKRSYREVFNEDDRKYIAELFREEISLLGYEW